MPKPEAQNEVRVEVNKTSLRTWNSNHLPLLPAFSIVAAKSLQSCPTLCDPIEGSPPGSPVPGILQARTLEWVAISFLQCMKVKSEREVPESCPTLSGPMDCSLPGSSVHGIFQARLLEWGAIAFFIVDSCSYHHNLHYIESRIISHKLKIHGKVCKIA